ncbi:MAG: prephenate dehydrogenase/arogenate dehydrogenase family protein [Acidobacteriota bacterium]|nr:prephenate dehydrogenase/arogenate dehydrogenase family protein [Acidobacteriota bacterium]
MRVAVVGLGLIGGSIALAARERLGAEVSGWDADPAALDAAAARGAISSGAGSLASAVAAADLVFTAAPVDVLPDLLDEVLAHAPAGAVVSDVGSTKRTIVEAVADPRFVGGHPLAGAETSGVEHADAALFEGSTWYLTPSAATSTDAIVRVESLVAEFGATVTHIDAAQHDSLMAAVSHLPHVFANVLLSHLLATSGPSAIGPSFRDATRVAGSNPEVWSSIYLDNRDELVHAIDHAVELLQAVREDLDRADADALLRWCRRAAADRQRLGR